MHVLRYCYISDLSLPPPPTTSLIVIINFICPFPSQGTISGYNSTTNTHTVKYDDGDIRDYVLPNKAFKFINVSL